MEEDHGRHERNRVHEQPDELGRAARSERPGKLPAESLPEGLTFTWETFEGVISEALPMLREHFKEVQNYQEFFPFEPDWKHYFVLESSGCFTGLAVRDRGVLIGYCGFVVTMMLHTKHCKRARTDSFYIDPVYRSLGLWRLMRLEIERHMREIGVHRLEFVPKCTGGVPLGQSSFERDGYELIEATFAKLIRTPDE